MCLTVLFFYVAGCVDDIDRRKGSVEPTSSPVETTVPPTTTQLPPVPPIPQIPPPPDEQVPFTTEWDIEEIEGELKIILPLPKDFEYDFEVDWGDDQRSHVSSWDDQDKDHVYKERGRYTVKILGRVQAWSFKQFPHSRDQLSKIVDLGSVGWLDLSGAFQECDNLTAVVASKGEFTAGVTNMANMFEGADSVNPDVANWDTSAVDDLSGMFKNTGMATPDVSNWDTSNVTDMAAMFDGAAASDDLKVAAWDTSKVTDMSRMFANTGSDGSMDKNPYLVDWNFSAVQSMEGMLIGQTLSTESYSNMLDKISEGTVMKDVTFDAGNSRHNAIGAKAKQKLISESNWTVFDGGADLN